MSPRSRMRCTSHTCSIGDKSDDQVGKSTTKTLLYRCLAVKARYVLKQVDYVQVPDLLAVSHACQFSRYSNHVRSGFLRDSVSHHDCPSQIDYIEKKTIGGVKYAIIEPSRRKIQG